MASTPRSTDEVVEIRENPECDPECRPTRCTVFCQARQNYRQAMRDVDRASFLGDLHAIATALEYLSGAVRLVTVLHHLPVGSGLTERSTTR